MVFPTVHLWETKSSKMSTNIKILGTGCSKCKQTIAMVEEVLRENNIEARIEKVEDIVAIMNYNVMAQQWS